MYKQNPAQADGIRFHQWSGPVEPGATVDASTFAGTIGETVGSSQPSEKVRMDNAQLINQDTGCKEWYTPCDIITLARAVLGGIDLDPSSCEEANQVVRAFKIYTKDDDGLSHEWSGRIWMNHPFSKERNADWINKLVDSYNSGAVSAACCISFASTSERWFRPLLDFPQVFFTTRTRYTSPGALKIPAPPKGSVVTYLGPNVSLFATVFQKVGVVKIPYSLIRYA